MTQDTEWEKEVESNCKIERYGSADKYKYWHVKYSDVITLLSSRDTYWKERVQEIVKKERGTWAKESIGDKALQSLEVALLDNLK